MCSRLASSIVLAFVAAACGDADQGRRSDDGSHDITAEVGGDDVTDTDVVPDVTVVRPELPAAPSTAGIEHWVGFLENLSLASNGPPTFAFFVSAPGASERVIGHAEVPSTGYSQAFEVPVGEVVKVTMPSGILYPQLNEVPSKLGARVTADVPLEVVAVHYRVYFSEASRLLPTPELGDEYVVVTAVDHVAMSPSAVVVVATEDDTTFEIEPSTVTTGFLATGMAHRFTLQAGETMQFQAGGDLSGTRIRALGGQRLAVFAGAREANVGCQGANSHLWDQMIPVARWGKLHVVVPMRGGGATPIKVVADRFKTVVEVACQDDVIVNPGGGAQFAVAQPSVIRSNEPIGVVALIKSNACNLDGNGDPNMVAVPALGLTGDDFAWFALDDWETLAGSKSSVNVVTRAADASELRLDGAAVTLAPIPGTPELVFAQLEVAAGPHRLTSTRGFQANAYGVAPFDAYSFGGGWGCTDCAALGAPDVPTGCDPGDLRVDRVPDGPDGTSDPDPVDPEDPECVTACDCYTKHEGNVVDICPGSEPDGPRAIWACDGTCRPACGSPCEACPERFPTNDGRCEY